MSIFDGRDSGVPTRLPRAVEVRQKSETEELDPDLARIARERRVQAELEKSVAEWRERATLAETLNKSLDAQVAELTKDRDQWRDKFLGEREQYVRVEEQLSLASNVIIQAANKSRSRREAIEKEDVSLPAVEMFSGVNGREK